MAPKPKPQKNTILRRTIIVLARPAVFIRVRTIAFMARRPHRSFRLTRRRDYVRSLSLPGYISFTNYVQRTIWKNRKVFIILVTIYALFTALLVGIASQDTYSLITDTLQESAEGSFEANFGELGKAGILFIAGITGGFSQTLTEVQQVYAVLIGLMVWLTTVWILRNILAGHRVKVRDGLYNASAPLLSTFLVALILVVQLLPIALALIGYSAALTTGLLDGGVEAMLFWIAAGLLTILSLYWITSTLMALIIVTLPGMYPLQALRTAGDLVVGRRVRILLRVLWMLLCIVVTWAIIVIPMILLDGWLKSVWPQIAWLPIIPIVLLVVTSGTVVWAASYIYLLYRRIVADDAAPAS